MLFYFVLLCFVFAFIFCWFCSLAIRGIPYGEMAKVMDGDFEVSEFELQSRFYIHFQTDTL